MPHRETDRGRESDRDRVRQIKGETERHAHIIAANSPTALKRNKDLIMGPIREKYREAIEKEGLVYEELMGGPENTEAINAFLEKRDPDFSSLGRR